MSTLLQLRTKVRTQMDLLDEPAVTDAEITEKLNEGIDVVESILMDLYEDYFLKRGTAISLVAGTSEYSYPADIWGNKLRALVYRNGTRVFRIPRFAGNRMNSFELSELAEAQGSGPPEAMTFRPLNSTFRLSPAPLSSEASVLIPWYIRQAQELSLDADECDIPEWEHVVVAYAKHAIAEDKPGLGDVVKLEKKLTALMDAMEASLANRSPDEDDTMDKDMSFYTEST